MVYDDPNKSDLKFVKQLIKKFKKSKIIVNSKNLGAAKARNIGIAKSKGSSNPHNVVKATFDGLKRLRDPLAVSKQRGVSLNKIFNG